MRTTIHRANSRGRADHGWLKAAHSFSFGGYFNPARMGFGALRVLNDDWIAGGQGFPTHPHDNMEIVTIPLSGALAHRDSTGAEGVIRQGEVQIMSAGTGIRHSEFNASATEPATLLQIWVLPKEEGIAPRYAQKNFGLEGRRNRWQTVVAPDEREGALWINQHAFFSLASLEPGKELRYQLHGAGQLAYLFVISGQVTVDGQELGPRDAIGVSEADSFSVAAGAPAEVIVIEVP